jgi:hypothetical protein
VRALSNKPSPGWYWVFHSGEWLSGYYDGEDVSVDNMAVICPRSHVVFGPRWEVPPRPEEPPPVQSANGTNPQATDESGEERQHKIELPRTCEFAELADEP